MRLIPDAPEEESLTCRDAIGLLAEYLESALTPDALAELEEHLAECEECRAYLNTYRKTRDLSAAAGRLEMPPEMRRRIREFLIEWLAAGDR